MKAPLYLRQRAESRGVKLLSNVKVTALSKLNSGNYTTVVHTNCGDFNCKKVIITAGAWINEVLKSTNVKIPVRVTQENVTYFASRDIRPFTKENFPVFIYKGVKFDTYALPAHAVPCFKIGFDAAGNQALGAIRETKVCLYTMTPDRHFVVDSLRTRDWPHVLVCCGAGHAFKFSAILGRTLAQLALGQQCPIDLSHFKVDRPAITDPKFPWWQDTKNDAAFVSKM